ncbi:MFS transporter [Ferrovibrio sp.]|uniref:MFS transporter n=1 Tax=Ferrovibrio sp. TaxID=1917215 RepID=UPI003D0F121E
MEAPETAVPQAPLPPLLIFALATGAGLGVANIYYNQPMLGLIEESFGVSTGGLVPTVTQLGYALGLLLLVPFGDMVERKRLILAQFGLLMLALALAAWAPAGFVLIAASFAIGAMATVAQQIVPLTAHLAPAAKRGATVGTVMAGLLCGILLSRTLAGYVATHFGWRAMFLLGVPLALFALLWLALMLPQSRGESRLGYGRLLLSMIGLWRELPVLRLAAFTQASLFAAFSCFWTVLALYLAQPPYNLGPEAAGLFGIAGAIGIAAAPIAGRIADRHGPRPVILIGGLGALLSWVCFGFWLALPGLVVGVLLLDFAMQAVLISNQHIIFALRPEARGRINTLFMATMFLGGAIGSMTGMFAWQQSGWEAVCLLGGGFALMAMAWQRFGLRPA